MKKQKRKEKREKKIAQRQAESDAMAAELAAAAESIAFDLKGTPSLNYVDDSTYSAEENSRLQSESALRRQEELRQQQVSVLHLVSF